MNKIADIIIPHHDRHDRLKNCLDRLPNDIFNIIIVSGGSFARNCNMGAKIAQTENLIFLNDDTEPNIDVLREMAESDADMVGTCQKIPNMGIEKTYYGIGFYLNEGKFSAGLMQKKDDVHIPNGFLFKVKKKVWKKLGGLDEGFINGGEDSDFGLRVLQAGYRIETLDCVPTIHHHSQSKDRLKFSKENQALLDKKWEKEKIVKLLNLNINKLRVLIANNHLQNFGGSETFTYSLAKEFKRLGHSVDVFTFETGKISERLSDMMVFNPKPEYDLILVSHNTCLRRLREIRGFKILTCHGIYHKLEQPILGANAYVSISEEVQSHLKNKGYQSYLIRNGIDCDRFKPVDQINEKVKKVLSLCQGDEANSMIRDACMKIGVRFEALNRNIFDVENKINEADLVFSLGRGAYEAMACGRDVFIFDTRGYNSEGKSDGFITMENVLEVLKNNCSGRRYQKEVTSSELTDIIVNKYDKKRGDKNRIFALKNLNIKNQVNKYLKIYEEQAKNSGNL